MIYLLILVHLAIVAAVFATIYFLSSSPPKLIWHGAHVVITGGSKGIGKELARLAVKAGANITLIARGVHELRLAQQELMLERCDDDQNVHWYSLDLTVMEEDKMTKVIAEAESRLGPVDLLVNNAGGPIHGYFEDISLETYEQQMKLNFLSAVGMTHAVLPFMKNRHKGRIVFVNSLSGQLGLLGYVAYAPAKFTLRGFVDSLSMELAPYSPQISLQLAYPPGTATDRYLSQVDSKPEETKLLADAKGRDSLVSPQEVAQTIKDGIDIGTYSIYVGHAGRQLAAMTAGAGPYHTFKEGVEQIFFSGIIRLFIFKRIKIMYDVVEGCFEKRRVKK